MHFNPRPTVEIASSHFLVSRPAVQEASSVQPFVTACTMLAGDGMKPRSTREVRVAIGLPVGGSTEPLEVLDEEQRVMSYSIFGGDRRLVNYLSTLTVMSQPPDEGAGVVVIEPYVTDVPPGSTEGETCLFTGTI